MLNALSRISVDSYVLVSILSAFLSMLLLTCVLLLLRQNIRRLVQTVLAGRRLRRPDVPATKKPAHLLAHLDHLLRSVLKRPLSPTAFLAMEVVLFFLVMTASASNLPLSFAVPIGLCFASIPYLFLRLRLERIRRRGSFEGEGLMAALLTQYWVSGGNIFDTIERVLSFGKGMPISRKLLASFLIELRSTGSRERIRAAADAFAFGIGTNWSRMLAYNIRIAAVGGRDIGLALEDILVQLREARTLHEERKRLNSESARLVVVLIPVIYGGSILVSVGMLGLSIPRFFRNQFLTPEGFGLFCCTAFLFLANIVLLEVATNRKLDF
ncbi:MAG: hypothetical protein LBD12_04640 [Clostridiales Family XIII bacterium]|jgi:hypothetical protein|nr:hypothetical protein [Clostridiales Family XIII bacterium]